MTYTAIVTTSMTTDRATAQIVIYITNVEGHAAALSPPSFQTPTRPRVSGARDVLDMGRAAIQYLAAQTSCTCFSRKRL